MGDIYYEWITGKKEERMNREEKAIMYFKHMREKLCEDYLLGIPKNTVAYKATMAEKEFYDTAIKALEQEPKTGRWIEHEHNGIGYLECPRCSVWFLWMHLTRNSYCPNCGAKLGVEE